MTVKVQAEDFDVGREIAAITRGNLGIGAVASFVGTVRGSNDGSGVTAMTLEYYPGMTERSLEDIVAQAKGRWDIIDAVVVHRYGRLEPGEQIVLVVVAGEHRGETFAACEFIMDFLKTEAPFWKKEESPQGSRWVEVREADDCAARRWKST
jgi:molybdopterin synthase catalytic subunit